jgi:hypothetical protein
VYSLLSNRKAVFSIGNEPYVKTVHIGCPQGGVLSPFLWNLLVDNLLRTVFLFPVLFAAYADDTNVATSHKDPAIATQNLQLACNVVEAWLNSRKLILDAIITSFSFSHASSLLSPTFFSLLMESKSSPRWKYHSSDFCWTPN